MGDASVLSKLFVIVAGPNGAGKTTAVKSVEEKFSNILFLNADNVTAKELGKKEAQLGHPISTDPADPIRLAANLAAAQEVDNQLAAHIEKGEPVMVETVLSSEKYRKVVERAKELGYMTMMLYVTNADPAISINRVALRVRKGGHDVGEAKVVERWHKSHIQMAWFAQQMDELYVFDNTSDTGQELVFAKTLDEGTQQYGAPPNPYIADLIQKFTQPLPSQAHG